MLMTKQRGDLTFRYNLKNGRHGWLRLTPAYSIKVVQQILESHPAIQYVLEPFSGTGTTGLVCGERGINCDLFDINPFLVWFAKVKTANYSLAQLSEARAGAQKIVVDALKIKRSDDLWLPPISNITRWWTKNPLQTLAKIYYAINLHFPQPSPAKDLSLVAFCRLLIDWSNAAFNHQSMSFKTNDQAALFDHDEPRLIYDRFTQLVGELTASAEQPIDGRVRIFQSDSRNILKSDGALYDAVITSPPYPNRMSYIRELRPYMYWLGYLNEKREAADLDWQAIGGTWGVATSRLQKWEANGARVPHKGFEQMVAQISKESPLLANYVYKYFVDMMSHIQNVSQALKPGAQVFYIVGNSKFYETLVPVEAIYASLLNHSGFSNIEIEVLRKRNSKKELLEFVVSGTKDFDAPNKN